MTAKIKLNAASGGGSVSLKAPSTTTSNAAVELQLPVADGSANQFIKTDGSGNLSFAAAGGGKILQVVQESKKSTSSETVGQGTNDNSSGLTGDLISKAITPSNASNLILIRASLMVGISDDKQVFAQLFKAGSVLDAARGNSSVRQQVSAATYVTSSGRTSQITHEYLDTAGGTSAITYSYRFSHDSSTNKTIYLNRDHTNSANVFYVRGYSSLTLTEIEA